MKERKMIEKMATTKSSKVIYRKPVPIVSRDSKASKQTLYKERADRACDATSTSTWDTKKTIFYGGYIGGARSASRWTRNRSATKMAAAAAAKQIRKAQVARKNAPSTWTST